MTMTLDYNEPLPKVLARLKSEHRDLVPKLRRLEQLAQSVDLKVVITELKVIKPLILRHAVEEEARLMRPIMWEFKDKAEDSIIVLRYHRELVDFLEHKLPDLATMPDQVARREVGIFVKELRKHHLEEEKTLFPLALKANSKYEKHSQK